MTLRKFATFSALALLLAVLAALFGFGVASLWSAAGPFVTLVLVAMVICAGMTVWASCAVSGRREVGL